MGIVEKKGITPYVIIQSFDARTLRILNDEYPHVRTSYLVGPARKKNFKIEIDEDIETLGFIPDIYSPHYKYVTKENVEECHRKGMKMVVYTPNTKEEIDQLKAIGVDGVITDFPELFRE